MTTQQRKRDHLDICMKKDVEVGNTGFDEVTLIHSSLPEMDFEEINTEIEFFGKKLRIPLMIAAVTGGVAEAKKINRDLAAVAERKGIGFGLGSQRTMIEKPEVKDTYHVRDVAPNILLLGNIGIAQLKKYGAEEIDAAMDTVGVDAVCVHTNPAQEIFQSEGDTDFRGCLEALGKLCKQSRYPIIAKEVGNGVSKEIAFKFREMGVKAIDVGGHGGTNWIVVDGIRAGRDVSLFKHWGIPTAASILEARASRVPIIATGGVRNGLDIAKSIALGASCCGIALPFLRTLGKGGREGVEKYIDVLENELRMTMFLTGCKSIKELRNTEYVIVGSLRQWMHQRGLE